MAIGSRAAWLILLLTMTSTQLLAQQTTGQLDYYRQIQPILVRNCITCHGPGKQESKFRIDLAASLLKGASQKNERSYQVTWRPVT